MRGFYLHLVSVSLDSPARDALLRPVARSSFFPPLRLLQLTAQLAVRLLLLKGAFTKRSCAQDRAYKSISWGHAKEVATARCNGEMAVD
jgi:hypothetical protein